MARPFKGVISIEIPTRFRTEAVDAADRAGGTPNVLCPIVLDDVGFSAMEPFRGLIKTPNINRIAEQGLTYTNFHTTALCSRRDVSAQASWKPASAVSTARGRHRPEIYEYLDQPPQVVGATHQFDRGRQLRGDLRGLRCEDRRETQFYSMGGTRAIWHRGWKAAADR
jgi:arylsulfatase A-like enzyme